MQLDCWGVNDAVIPGGFSMLGCYKTGFGGVQVEPSKQLLQRSVKHTLRHPARTTCRPMGCHAALPRRSVWPSSLCSCCPCMLKMAALPSAPPVSRLAASSDCEARRGSCT